VLLLLFWVDDDELFPPFAKAVAVVVDDDMSLKTGKRLSPLFIGPFETTHSGNDILIATNIINGGDGGGSLQRNQITTLHWAAECRKFYILCFSWEGVRRPIKTRVKLQ